MQPPGLARRPSGGETARHELTQGASTLNDEFNERTTRTILRRSALRMQGGTGRKVRPVPRAQQARTRESTPAAPTPKGRLEPSAAVKKFVQPGPGGSAL